MQSPKSEVIREAKFSLKIYSINLWLAELDKHQTSKPVVITVMSPFPIGNNFIFAEDIDVKFVQKSQNCQIYVVCETFHPLHENA